VVLRGWDVSRGGRRGNIPGLVRKGHRIMWETGVQQRAAPRALMRKIGDSMCGSQDALNVGCGERTVARREGCVQKQASQGMTHRGCGVPKPTKDAG